MRNYVFALLLVSLITISCATVPQDYSFTVELKESKEKSPDLKTTGDSLAKDLETFITEPAITSARNKKIITIITLSSATVSAIGATTTAIIDDSDKAKWVGFSFTSVGSIASLVLSILNEQKDESNFVSAVLAATTDWHDKTFRVDDVGIISNAYDDLYKNARSIKNTYPALTIGFTLP